jgi:parallel beta-helix repeat protein/predicted outer membrane repeat protein
VFQVVGCRSGGEGLLSLEVANCCFENCQAEDKGGVIDFNDPEEGQHFHVGNCTFANCTGEGAIHIESYYHDLDAQVTGSTFTANKGAVDVDLFQGTVSIANSAFSGNLERPALDFMSMDEASITDCTFTGNTSNENGAAISSDLSTITVSGCSFSENSLQVESYGGAVWTRDFATIEHCTFSGNAAHSGAGAAVWDVGVLRACTFDGNHAEHDGGALHLEGQASDCTFTNNTAGDDGGAVFLRGGTLEGATVTDNVARLWGGGVNASDGTVSGCLIQGNESAGAGGLRMQHGVVRTCEVIGNTATKNGYGGIMAEASSVYGCTVQDNQAAGDDGGGMLAEGSLISGCLVENNAADEEGGGMVVRDSTLSDCVIRNNTASEGGGIRCWGDNRDEGRFYDLVISGNTPNACYECVGCP